MTKPNQIYLCEQCGNMVEVIEAGQGQLVCCEVPMKRMSENSGDAAQEKHIPLVTREGKSLHVKVGSVIHPMTPEHLIEWVEMFQEDRCIRVFLKPGLTPELRIPAAEAPATVRAFCNLHGLWKTDV